jgi:hypothetical protein
VTQEQEERDAGLGEEHWRDEPTSLQCICRSTSWGRADLRISFIHRELLCVRERESKRESWEPHGKHHRLCPTCIKQSSAAHLMTGEPHGLMATVHKHNL